ncbi:hypothetical protein [uncultured Bacteroides sp.]|uniref:hypothetical protein n=1 Tax=uncultured Bacteroides sp. TaxID=162156 RepID=UPI00263A1265|nr:hypothetical protein [uncultured Bacteroides sp.]
MVKDGYSRETIKGETILYFNSFILNLPKTKKKIDSCFTDAISELAEEYNCSFEEMRAQLKRQYDDPLSARNIIQ